MEKACDPPRSVISGAIIDDNDFQITVGLRDDALEALFDNGGSIECWDDDGHLHGTITSSFTSAPANGVAVDAFAKGEKLGRAVSPENEWAGRGSQSGQQGAVGGEGNDVRSQGSVVAFGAEEGIVPMADNSWYVRVSGCQNGKALGLRLNQNRGGAAFGIAVGRSDAGLNQGVGSSEVVRQRRVINESEAFDDGAQLEISDEPFDLRPEWSGPCQDKAYGRPGIVSLSYSSQSGFDSLLLRESGDLEKP